MVFAKSEFLNVARLARLSFSEEEMARIEGDLERIIGFVKELREVDITDVEPMSYPGERALLFRDDETQETLGRKCIDSSAGYEDGLVKVPKIIE